MNRKRYSWESARAMRVEINLNYQRWVLRCVYLCTNERIHMMAVCVDDERVSTRTVEPCLRPIISSLFLALR